LRLESKATFDEVGIEKELVYEGLSDKLNNKKQVRNIQVHIFYLLLFSYGTITQTEVVALPA